MSKRIAYCTEGAHFPSYVINSHPADDGDNLDRWDVIASPEGESSNTWYDGTRGVPERVRDLCDSDEEPTCPDCNYGCSFQDVPDDFDKFSGPTREVD